MRANGNGNGRAPANEPAPNAADHINGNGNAPYKRADRRGERVLLSGHVAPSVREHAAQLAERRGISVGDLLAELLDDRAPAILDPVDAGLDPLPPGPFGTILADPPWRFTNRTGKVAPEHRRLSRYDTMTLDEICAIPVADTAPAAAPPLPLGAQRPARRRPAGDAGLGLRLQEQHRLAQDPQGRRAATVAASASTSATSPSWSSSVCAGRCALSPPGDAR